MFLVHAFQQLMEAYGTYFAYALLFLISIPIAVIRVFQVLYHNRLSKLWHVLTEVVVELARLAQYIIVLAKGTDTALRSLLSFDAAWGELFAGIRNLQLHDAIWEFIGFLIVFALYNALLSALIRQPPIAALLQKRSISRFEAESVRSSILIALKNLFLIPVSVIFIFQILHFL